MTTPPPVLPNTPPEVSAYKSGQVVDPVTLKFRRAVKDAKQAHSICKKLIEYNRPRINKSAAIMRKYNDEQPWDPNKLKSAGQSWRHNRSTAFLSSMISRILPPYKQLIDSAKYLTSSKLKGHDDDSNYKSECFQNTTTRVVRQWNGWNDFSHQIILENILMGHGTACWTDPFGWKPLFARDDEAIFPDGCPQMAPEVPLWLLKQNFQIHELADKFEDPGASEAVGWNLENLVKAINAAQPENRKKGNQENLRKFEDTIRETTIGRSYSEGVKVVETYNLFVKEATGKVSHYIVDAKNGNDLFTQLDRFESMDQCLQLLSIEIGNGKLYGSKGAGRKLYNTHVAADQARNNICDALYLSGIILLKATQKGKDTVAITVTHPFAVLGDNFEVVDVKFEVNTDAFFQLDRHLVSIAEVQVGAFMPGQILDAGGEKRTASEINYTASIEQQIKEGVLSRFWGQYLTIIGEMQRRIYSTDNIKAAMAKYKMMSTPTIAQYAQKMMNFMKSIGRSISGAQVQIHIEEDYDYPEAIDAIVELFQKGLTAEEIYELANSPANTYTQDVTQQNAQATSAAYAKYKGDPKINQQKLITRDVAALLGNDAATELVIPEEDNTLQAEATRLQLFEIDAMMGGDDIPVSPRDVDDVHMSVMEQKGQTLLQTLNPQSVTQLSVDIAKRFVSHYGQHLQSATTKGATPDSLKPREEFIKKASMIIDMASKALAGAPQSGNQIPSGATPAIAPTSGPAPSIPSAGAPPPVEPSTIPNQPIPPNQPGGKPLISGPRDLSVKPTLQ
jgi:hypothetical protein